MSAAGIWLVSNVYGTPREEAVMWECHLCGLDVFLWPPFYQHADRVRRAHRCPDHEVHTASPLTTFKRKPRLRELVALAFKYQLEFGYQFRAPEREGGAR